MTGLIGTKLYLQPTGTILNAIHDIQELQKGKSTFSDTEIEFDEGDGDNVNEK